MITLAAKVFAFKLFCDMKTHNYSISRVFIVSISILLFVIISPKSYGQNADTVRYCIETIDGNIFIGSLHSSDSSQFIINTGEYGIVKVNVNKIDKIYQLTSTKLGTKEYWHRNIQAARYFWAPNGYGLKKGEGYYQNYWVLFNQVSYGFTDYFSAGFGMMPLFIFAGAPTPIWITPKFSIPVVKDKFNVGVGGLFGAVIGEGGTSFGLAYGTTTYGSRDLNVSLGLGWGYGGESWADAPLINISGIVRVGRKGGYIMTENYFIRFDGEDYIALISFGGRNLINSISIDYGLFLPISNELDSFFAFPWLGITIPFQKKK